MTSNNADEVSRYQDVSAPSAGDYESLQHYTNAKLAIAGQLRTFLDLLQHRGNQTLVQQCEQLTAKLAEDRFTIVVLGQFKRGKSSLLNAIIGRDLLPTGILPLTSVITVVRYGASERLVIYRKTMQFPDCDSIDTLDTYVTEKHNPGNQKGIEMVVIEIPLPFLRRGLEFVDTPGIGSAITANTETTYSFLPNCDAVLFVTSVDSPLSEAEIVLLRSIRPIAAKIFFILNKMDLLADDDDAVQVIDFVKSRLSREMDAPEVNLVALSARRGLQANENNTPDQLRRSGLLLLQETLAQFLASERQHIFLRTVIDRASRLVAAELQETELDAKAGEASANDLKRWLDEVKARMDLSQGERLQILMCMRERCSQYLAASVAEELAVILNEETQAAISRLGLLLRQNALVPSVCFITRFNQEAGRRFSVRISAWVVANRQRLVDDLNAATLADFKELHEHLSGLASLPRKALGLPNPEVASLGEEFDMPPLDPRFELEVGGNTTWKRNVPVGFRFLPVLLVWTWLRRYLDAELRKLAEHHRGATIEIIERTVHDSVLALGRKASVHVAGLERRATTLLSKSLKGSGNGEGEQKAGLYRRGIQTLEANFVALRERMRLKTPLDVPLESVQPLSVPSFKPDEKPTIKTRDRRTYATRGCAACDYLVRMSKEFFAAFQYSLYNDERQQRSFAENGGFCPFHLWHLESISSPVGFSVGVSNLVKRVARSLESQTPTSAFDAVQQVQPPTKKCLACVFVRETEYQFISTFVPTLSEPDNKKLYTESLGLCLHHLELAIAASPDQETTNLLLRTASAGFRLIAEDMEGFALKRTASRRYMVTGDEEHAHLRAVIHLAGAKHNCMPWTFDDEI